MGMDRNIVKIEKYNENWAREYEKEKKILTSLIGNYILNIYHIGSTAIKGISAKPIIDIIVSVEELKFALKFRDILELSGYNFEEGNTNKEYLVIKGTDKNTTHIIHILIEGSERLNNCIIFRDYLNTHIDEMQRYQKLKEGLAKKYMNDRKKYTTSKTKFIQNIISIAKEENYK